MRKYWKSIAAIVLVVAVVATVALSTIDWRLRATDNDGNIGSGEVVEQQIEVTQPTTESTPVETQPVEVYNTYEETQVTVAETTAAETPSETTTQPVSKETSTEAETTTEEQTTTAAPNRSVRLRTNLDDGTTPYEGMTVVLTVELEGFEDCQYTIKWQRSTDNINWEDIPGATGEEYRFTLTEETNGYYWNAQVTVG